MRNASSVGTFRSSSSRSLRRLLADRVRMLGADENATVGAERARDDRGGEHPGRGRVLDVAANSSGRPTSCRSQSTVSSSSSWSAGDVRQRIPTWLSPAMRSSASTPGSAPGRREVGEEARALPVREPRQEHGVEVVEDGRERLGVVGRRGRQSRADRAGLDLRQDREVAHALEIRRDPVERERAVVAERAHVRSFSISRQVRVFSTCSFVSHARRACATPNSA